MAPRSSDLRVDFRRRIMLVLRRRIVLVLRRRVVLGLGGITGGALAASVRDMIF
jgi:hypothetical protein